jgi:hypothetical protein
METGVVDVAPGLFGRPVLPAKLGVTSDLQITVFAERDDVITPFPACPNF